MKKLSLLVALFAAILFVACKKDKADADNSFYVKAKKNEAGWQAAQVQAYKTGDLIRIITRAIPAGQTLPEETFILEFKINSKGEYQATTEQTQFYNTVGLDVAVTDYKLLNNTANQVTVTNYNQNNNTLKGTFSLSFQNVHPSNHGAAELKLTEGKFFVKLKNQQ